MNSLPQKKWTSHRLIPFILLVALTFIFFQLGIRPLNNPDEGRYTQVALNMVTNNDYVIPHMLGMPFFDKPPIYYWLQLISIKIFGSSTFSIRFFPAVFAFAMFALVWWVSSRVVQSLVAGLLISLVMISFPLYYVASRYADMNLEVTVFIGGALLFFFLGYSKTLSNPQHRKYFYLAYICAGLGFLTKGMIGIVFPAAIIGIWIFYFRKWKLIWQARPLAGIIIVLAIALPWVVMAAHRNPEFLYRFFVEQQFVRFTSTEHKFNNMMPWWFYLATLPGFLGAWFIPLAVKLFNLMFKRQPACSGQNALQVDNQSRSGYPSEPSQDTAPIPTQRGARADLKREYVGLASIWVVFVIIFFSIPQSKLLGYVSPALPALAIIIGLSVWEGLLGCASKLKTPRIIIALLVFNIMVTALLPISLKVLGLHSKWAGTSGDLGVITALSLLYIGLALIVLLGKFSAVSRLAVVIVGCFMLMILLNYACAYAKFNTSSYNVAAFIKQYNSKVKSTPITKVYTVAPVYLPDLKFYSPLQVYITGPWQELAATELTDSDISRTVHYCFAHSRLHHKCRDFATETDFYQKWQDQTLIYAVVRAERLQDQTWLSQLNGVNILFVDKFQGLALISNHKVNP